MIIVSEILHSFMV